jgi:hypothetical protein
MLEVTAAVRPKEADTWRRSTVHPGEAAEDTAAAATLTRTLCHKLPMEVTTVTEVRYEEV